MTLRIAKDLGKKIANKIKFVGLEELNATVIFKCDFL